MNPASPIGPWLDEMEFLGTVESVERLHHMLRCQDVLKAMPRAGGFRLSAFVTDHVAQGRVRELSERIGAYGWPNRALWWVGQRAEARRVFRLRRLRPPIKHLAERLPWRRQHVRGREACQFAGRRLRSSG